MKRHPFIGFLIGLALLATCTRPDDGSETRWIASPELSAIDSLMWRQPDSAFTVLQQFAASPMADSLDVFNGHYCQLLISELLYKNDWGQSNRPALQQAVIYFDSLCSRDAARHVSTNDNLIFLDARAHYINGVGYYEQGEVVPACAEYLKALEVMEGRFKEKELTGKKAIFMTYTYNRLMELFSAQFMMDPAIACGEKALMYCRIEPTSPEGVSNILYRLGKQYNKLNEIDKAKQYYGRALECMTNTDNLVYRDIVSNKALCDYLSGSGIELPIESIKRVLFQTDDVNERLTRYLTIGGIFFEERIYDSALYYLKHVFEKTEDKGVQAQSANYLRIIYDSIGDREQSDAYMRFLAEHKKSDGENKAMVSKLEDLFKDYTNRKQQKQAEEKRKKSIRKTIGIIVPIAVVVALSILVMAKLRSRKLLKKQQEEADKRLGETKMEHEQEMKLWQAKTEKARKRHEEELESERLAYRKEQEALRKSLKQHEERVKELETKQEHHHSEIVQQGLAFSNEPICRKIKDSISNLHLTARSNYGDYYYVKLDETDSVALGEAVAKHFPDFRTTLYTLLPKMDNKDLLMCYLYLLHLNNQQIAVLQQCHNSTIHRRSEQLQRDLNTDVPLPEFVRNLAFGHA